jgi:hypothetical protein
VVYNSNLCTFDSFVRGMKEDKIKEQLKVESRTYNSMVVRLEQYIEDAVEIACANKGYRCIWVITPEGKQKRYTSKYGVLGQAKTRPALSFIGVEIYMQWSDGSEWIIKTFIE